MLPDWVRFQLSALGANLDAIASALLDADGHWLVFETKETLVTTDDNGTNDIYRVDLLSQQIRLITVCENGQAGNGASGYPTADASGELIVFHSEADDLVKGDSNGVSDIFLHDFALGITELMLQLVAGYRSRYAQEEMIPSKPRTKRSKPKVKEGGDDGGEEDDFYLAGQAVKLLTGLRWHLLGRFDSTTKRRVIFRAFPQVL